MNKNKVTYYKGHKQYFFALLIFFLYTLNTIKHPEKSTKVYHVYFKWWKYKNIRTLVHQMYTYKCMIKFNEKYLFLFYERTTQNPGYYVILDVMCVHVRFKLQNCGFTDFSNRRSIGKNWSQIQAKRLLIQF